MSHRPSRATILGNASRLGTVRAKSNNGSVTQVHRLITTCMVDVNLMGCRWLPMAVPHDVEYTLALKEY